ncbi:MAG: hypothetical protein L6R36_001966 [Xanthoria steineri]|nr:MAG: hypothetical protein L6R36_001966 [Xanthoria steineri]
MAPNPYVGRNLAISVSSGSTTDDERAVRPSNPKSRRYRRPIIQSDASTDISDKEPDDQTTEGASTTNLFDAASAQTNTSEGRAAAIPDEDHVQRPTPAPRPAKSCSPKLYTDVAAAEKEWLSIQQTYLARKVETDRQEDALQATKAEVTATLSYLNVLGDRVGKQEVELAGRRAVDTRLSEQCSKALARWKETKGERDALLEDE